MKWYHAQPKSIGQKFLNDMRIHKSIDGGVYLTETAKDAFSFQIYKAIAKHDDLWIFELEGLDGSLIEETFDHNTEFFRCKSYMYLDEIDLHYVDWDITEYLTSGI